MHDITRRTFTQQSLASLLTYSLLECVSRNEAFADEVRPIADGWLKQLNELSNDVKEQRVQQVEWQKQVEELFAKVDLAELLKFIDFERLTTNAKLVDNGARSLRFKFPQVEGLPTQYVFGKQIFGLKQGRSVVPHGHNNMATAFLILQGKLRGRHYDRLEDQQEHFLIRPTIDRAFKPGQYSTVSDYKDNVHWFQAETEPAYILNIHVLNVRVDSKLPTGRVYLNPQGEKLANGLIRAPKLGYKEAHKLFG